MYSFHQEWLHTQSFFPAETLPTLPTLDKRDAFLFICTFQIDGYFLSFFFFLRFPFSKKKKCWSFLSETFPCIAAVSHQHLDLICH